MPIKYLSPFWVLFTGLLLLGISGCRKEKNSDTNVNAEDHNNLITGSDAVIADAVALAGQVKGLSGKTEGGLVVLCGAASIDTGNGKQITINYDSNTVCKGILRTGQATVSLISGPFWKDAYAVLQVVFNNVVCTNTANNISYTINGTYTVINETGGFAWRILAGLDQNTSVKHRVQADTLSVIFPGGAQRVWSVDRTVEFASLSSAGNNTISITVSSENTNNVESWGVDRNGAGFTSTIINNIIANNNPSCPWRPYQGEYSQIVGGKSVDILYGVDSNGDPINNPQGCAYGYKITYSGGKKILTKIVPYIF